MVPVEALEEETVTWGREMLTMSPLALRMLKASLNAADDGLAGIQQLAGDATLLFYMTEEAQEGRDAYTGKRRPGLRQVPEAALTAMGSGRMDIENPDSGQGSAAGPLRPSPTTCRQGTTFRQGPTFRAGRRRPPATSSPARPSRPRRPPPEPAPRCPSPRRTSSPRSPCPFKVPLNRRFRATEHREGLLLCGPSGWAEWAPFPEYDDWEAARWLASAVEAAWGHWPDPVRAEVPVNVVVPALPIDDIPGYVTDAVARTGATTFKVKVADPGSALADDLARVATVRAALSESGVRDPLIRLDANGAWTVPEARRAARMFSAEFGPTLDYFEQPCRTTTELAELRYRLVDDEVCVRIAVDEGLRRARNLYADDLAASLRSAGDVLIVKVAPVGGVARALALIEEIGLPVVVSGEMNTSVGLCAGLALAAAVPDLAGAAGLGTGLLLAGDVCMGTLIPRDGVMTPTRRLPDEHALGRAADALGAEGAMWWRERLARCARLLSVI